MAATLAKDIRLPNDAAMAGTPIVQTRDLRISYHTQRVIVRAVRGLSLKVGPGEAVGIVGESGSGKSTLARSLLGLTDPKRSHIDGGQILIDGRDVTHIGARGWEAMRGSPIAMVFQDPLTYLNPVMRIGDQIAESIVRHDPDSDPAVRIPELLELVRLKSSLARAYPHELSGGMRQRALLAIALGCRPRLLIADEPTTALDVTTQAEIMALLRDLRERLGMAMLMISHDLGLVAQSCDRIYVMYAGQAVEWGASDSVFGHPSHPYTRGLFDSARALRRPDGRFVTIGGDVPDLAQELPGCPFAPRCAFVHADCETMPAPTPAVEVAGKADADRHSVKCWHVQKEASAKVTAVD